MAADPRGFLPAADAASGITTDLALHQECTAIERNILVQSSNGFISTTITNTLMTSNAFFAPLTVTAVDTVHNTVTIPGLAAEVSAAMPSCGFSLVGQPVTFSSTNLLPSPLKTQVTYYLVPTVVTDVYELSTTKQNAFQCPPIVMTLSATPAVVTGTTSITSTILGTNSIMAAIGIPGTLVIDGTSVPVLASDTLAQIVAAINAAAIPNLTASIEYTYAYRNNNNCNYDDDDINNCRNNPSTDVDDNGNPRYNYHHAHHRNNNGINNSVITAAYLVLTDSTGAAITIGAGSTSQLLTALGLTTGTFGEVGSAGNLIIDGHTVVINSTDTLTTIVANINAAAIPNVLASLSANGKSLVITDSTGAAITIGAQTALTGTGSIISTVGATGNLVINGVTVSILSADTLANVVTAINTAAIPNVIASTSSTYLVLINTIGGTITINNTTSAGILIVLGFTSGQIAPAAALILTALGLTAGTQAASVVSAIPSTQSELYYNAWKNIYFFPEQQIYVNLIQDVIKYFQSVGYNIIQQQQVDGSGNPIQAFQWYITWG